MRSKEFQNFQRPRCHVIGCILHGRGIMFAITDPDVPKDSNTHVELVAHLLTWVSQMGENLSDLSITLQCDNTPRECKNNVMLSFLASLVSKGCSSRCNFLFFSLRKFVLCGGKISPS